MKAKVNSLRNELLKTRLDGYIVPKADEYQNEFSAAYAERLAWISGFTGSAGLGVVSIKAAVLFVDGRYTLQANEQVDTDVFDVADLHQAAIFSWVKKNLKPKTRLGYDPTLHTKSSLSAFSLACDALKVDLVAVADNLTDALWVERPERPSTKIVEQLPIYSGKSTYDKCHEIGQKLSHQGAHSMVITMPDCIAWLLNVRATDIPCVPVVLSEAIVYATGRVDWFVDRTRFNFNVESENRAHIDVQPPETFHASLMNISCKGAKILVDESMTSLKIIHIILGSGAELINGNPVLLNKATKNACEVQGVRNAHIRDGTALVHFLSWFDHASSHEELTEMGVADTLWSFRKDQALFQGESFKTISGSGSHAAVVHYCVNAQTNRKLQEGHLFLIDSGAQYLDGTTDVTRTLVVGAPTKEHKKHFTLVLKGHIAIATCRFPKGTSGHQIDCLARHALWQIGLDYPHGTGHGVGSFLSVHEGPQSISDIPNTVPLEIGMILSNEPGYYKEGEYGIRIENLMTVVQSKNYPDFLEFETLTMAPINKQLIELGMLFETEVQWLNAYHKEVYEKIQTDLSQPSISWLKHQTSPV